MENTRNLNVTQVFDNETRTTCLECDDLTCSSCNHREVPEDSLKSVGNLNKVQIFNDEFHTVFVTENGQIFKFLTQHADLNCDHGDLREDLS